MYVHEAISLCAWRVFLTSGVRKSPWFPKGNLWVMDVLRNFYGDSVTREFLHNHKLDLSLEWDIKHLLFGEEPAWLNQLLAQCCKVDYKPQRIHRGFFSMPAFLKLSKGLWKWAFSCIGNPWHGTKMFNAGLGKLFNTCFEIYWAWQGKYKKQNPTNWVLCNTWGVGIWGL